LKFENAHLFTRFTKKETEKGKKWMLDTEISYYKAQPWGSHVVIPAESTASH